MCNIFGPCLVGGSRWPSLLLKRRRQLPSDNDSLHYNVAFRNLSIVASICPSQSANLSSIVAFKGDMDEGGAERRASYGAARARGLQQRVDL